MEIDGERYQKTLGWSSVLLTDFRKFKYLDRKNVVIAGARRDRKWVAPPHNAFKLNTYATINSHLNRASVGGLLRDCQGRLLLAFGKQITQPLSVVHGELLAIKEGVKLLYEMGFINVHIESDSLLAVQAVTTNQKNLGYVGDCAQEITSLLKEPIIAGISHIN
ncbi:uncharacterized protein [Henckelia pumila]|uniref:uncharacterized protein n=1 Tax=Henckelia pumila TaxID=405737 RepID=UPI003C6E2484